MAFLPSLTRLQVRRLLAPAPPRSMLSCKIGFRTCEIFAPKGRMNRRGKSVDSSTLRIGGSGGQPLKVLLRNAILTCSTCEISSGTSTPHSGVPQLKGTMCIYIFTSGIDQLMKTSCLLYYGIAIFCTSVSRHIEDTQY